jgi:hypothetical protein
MEKIALAGPSAASTPTENPIDVVGFLIKLSTIFVPQ